MDAEPTHKIVDVYASDDEDVFTGDLDECRGRAKALVSHRRSRNDCPPFLLGVYICLMDGTIVGRVR